MSNPRKHHSKGQARRSIFAASCVRCHARTEDGAALCPRCAAEFGTKPPSEAQRRANQPTRSHYISSFYLANRARRLQVSRFHCEGPSCGREIGRQPGDWECDHVVAIVDCERLQAYRLNRFPISGQPTCDACPKFDACPLDHVSNLRAFCPDCHHEKTAIDRANRRRR